MNSDERTPLRVWGPALAVLAAGYLALTVRFEWLCDDAFISMRYARNLARGDGLVFNVGERPVEGYTNLLWTLVLAAFEWLGLATPLFARALSAACGLVLLLLVARATRRLGRDAAPSLAAAALLALAPPYFVWSTSGLETMPFALALFATFAALADKRPSVPMAVASAACAVLLRADGFALVTLTLAASLAAALGVACPERRRAVLRTCAFVAVLVALHFLWRRWRYDAWTPNTARAKVEFGFATLQSGLNYVGTFLLSFPSVLLAALFAAWRAISRRDAYALAALAVAAGVFGYAALVGGDFMAMGRFLVPSLAFVALSFGLGFARRERQVNPLGVVVAALVCAALSLPAAWNLHLAPASLRQELRFRWNNAAWLSESEQWTMMREQALRWSALGRALNARTRPGESLVLGTIGAVGYYSELWIHDPFGLVNREEFAPLTEADKRTPGHFRRVPLETFLAKQPTYLEAALVPREQPYGEFRSASVPGGLRASKIAKPEWVEVADVPGLGDGLLLRLTRYTPPSGD